MKRLSYFVMTALLIAGLSTTGMAQDKKAPAKSAAATKKVDPCADQKAAVKSAKDASGKKTATSALKTCTDANKPAASGKKAPATKKKGN